MARPRARYPIKPNNRAGAGMRRLLLKGRSDLQGLRRWGLVTRDAHELYRQFEFVNVAAPKRYMEITRPNIYKQP